MPLSNLKAEQLNDLSARAMGWIDYPEDSVERGTIWHCDPKKAPFDTIVPKDNWHPTKRSFDAMKLMTTLHINVEFLHTAHGPVYAVQASPKGYGHCGHEEPMSSPQDHLAVLRAITKAAALLWLDKEERRHGEKGTAPGA